MRNHKELVLALKKICENVYFVPPEGTQLIYPCIVIERSYPDISRANNMVYRLDMGYRLTYMSKKSSDDIINTLLYSFKTITYSNTFRTDGIFHIVFNIYY